MDSSFNMDCILGNPLSIRNDIGINNDSQKHNWIYENIGGDDKEERMLPDSSLSPSNQSFFGYLMDESKSSDTESNKLHIEKNIGNTDVSIYNKHCRLVIDSKGDEYLVAETHLVPIIEACKDLYDHPVSSPSKECSITTTTTCITLSDAPLIDSKSSPRAQIDNTDGPIMESFLYASQLALVEVKLKDLEKELSTLDRFSVSKFVNCAANLMVVEGEGFIPVIGERIGAGYPDLGTTDLDGDRRARLGQLFAKHARLKRWLAKIKRKLKEKNESKLCHIIDFSSKDDGVLPLPAYFEDHQETTHVGQSAFDEHDLGEGTETESLSSTDYVEGAQHSGHLQRLSDLIDRNSCHQDEDENGNIVGGRKMTSRAPSKDGSDPEGLPNLSYEYDSCRDSDINFKGAKSSSDDHVISTDSDCLNNQSPPTPDLRRAELDSNDISDGIRVLVVQKDYLRAGVIHVTSNPVDDQKLWRVTIDGDRKCQDIVISEWQLLEQGVREVIPTSTNQLSPGSRVCANWSVQLPLNLYPGMVSLSSVDDLPSLDKLSIDFDDGDHKDVDLDQVRLLPENFPNLHELMKASNFLESNFYSLDRKNRIKKQRLTRLKSGVKEPRKSITVTRSKVVTIKAKKRGAPLKQIARKKKVQWKLVRKGGATCVKDVYELVRNLDELCIRGGESVQLLSYSRHIYMANVVRVLAKHQATEMEIELNWYYILADVQDNSDIVRRLKKCPISKKVIFKTSHTDVNDVYSVLRKVEVLSFEEYKCRYLDRGCQRDVAVDVYVLVGHYDQAKGKVDSVDDGIMEYVMA